MCVGRLLGAAWSEPGEVALGSEWAKTEGELTRKEGQEGPEVGGKQKGGKAGEQGVAGPHRTRGILDRLKFYSRTIRKASKSWKKMGRWDLLPSNHDQVSYPLPTPQSSEHNTNSCPSQLASNR